MTQLTTALATVQTGLYSRLTGDATLMTMLAGQGVFDEVPENQAFDYITIANNFELRNDTFARRGRDVTITLDIWSQGHGFAAALAILDRCVFLLDRKPLTLASGSMSYINYNGAPQMLRDPDDQLTRHVVARFDACVEE